MIAQLNPLLYERIIRYDGLASSTIAGALEASGQDYMLTK